MRDYSEDDEDEPQDNLSGSSNESASSLQDVKPTEAPENSDNPQPQSAPAIMDSLGPGRSPSVGSASSRASMPATSITPQTGSLDRQVSEPQLPHPETGTQSVCDDQNDQNNSQRPSGRPKTYRETQFEKIFAANVVSMNDLKTLAWNGIPVS